MDWSNSAILDQFLKICLAELTAKVRRNAEHAANEVHQAEEQARQGQQNIDSSLRQIDLLSNTISREATIMAYNQVFYVMGIFLLIASALMLLLKQPAPRAADAEPLEARRMRLPAAERADIKDIGLQSRLQRRVIELGIVSERDDRCRGIEADLLEGFVGPVLHHLHAGEAAVGGEGAPGIDDGYVEIHQGRHRKNRRG